MASSAAALMHKHSAEDFAAGMMHSKQDLKQFTMKEW